MKVPDFIILHCKDKDYRNPFQMKSYLSVV